jgi:hypothetical protein
VKQQRSIRLKGDIMTRFIRMAAAPLALVALLSACKKSADEQPASRQVELAPKASAQPQLADTARTAAGAPSPTADLSAASDAPPPEAVAPPSAPAPKPTSAAPRQSARPGARQPAREPSIASSAAAAKPEPAPVSVAPITGTIAGGSALLATLGSRICTNTHRVGDRVTAQLASPVAGTNGAVIPAGASVTLRVTESVRGENGKEGMHLAFEPVSVAFGGNTYAISGSASVANMETVRAQTTGDQAKKVAVGAAVGALAGRLLGKKTSSTVAGAAVGAAAGAAVAVGTADWNGCVGEGGQITVTLSGPLLVRLGP